MNDSAAAPPASKWRVDRQRTILSLLVFSILTVTALWRRPVDDWASLAWCAGIMIMIIIRRPFAQQAKSCRIAESRRTLLEQALIYAMRLIVFVMPILHHATGILSVANYRLPSWAIALGAAVLASGLLLFWRSHTDLGKNWSVTLEIREGHNLVTGGIYRFIRHPMYAAFWLIVLAQTLLVQNWITGLSAILVFGAMYVIRIPREEGMMRQYFGIAYEKYAQNTGRIWPRFR